MRYKMSNVKEQNDQKWYDAWSVWWKCKEETGGGKHSVRRIKRKFCHFYVFFSFFEGIKRTFLSLFAYLIHFTTKLRVKIWIMHILNRNCMYCIAHQYTYNILNVDANTLYADYLATPRILFMHRICPLFFFENFL